MITIYPRGKINLGVTLDCGQSFRAEKIGDGEYSLVVGDREVVLKSETAFGSPNSEKIDIYGVGEESRALFEKYFACDAPYGEYIDILKKDEILRPIIEKYGTVRILRQDTNEALFSFIFSSCNNIERIKKIIESFCTLFGEKIDKRYTFPAAEKIAALTTEELSPIKCGFRDKYIISAAKKQVSGEVDLNKINDADLWLESAENELMKIDGVGKKVADCTLLFGCGRLDVFPVDRHIRRFVEEHYPSGLPKEYDKIKGLAQQYMFLSEIRK